MLIPTGGFGWITSNRPTASPGTSECLLTMIVPDQDGVVELIERARHGGAEVVSEPNRAAMGLRGDLRRPRRTRLASDPAFDSAPVHQVNAAPTRAVSVLAQLPPFVTDHRRSASSGGMIDAHCRRRDLADFESVRI